MLDLTKYKMKGISKITKIPGIHELNVKKDGLLYINKFFLFDGKNKDTPKMIGLASKTKNFSKLYAVIFYNLKLNPALTFILRDNYKDEDVVKFIREGVISSKYSFKSKIKENKSINEGLMDVVIDQVKKNPELLAPVLAIGVMFGMLFLITWIQKFFFLIKSIKNWATEYYVESKAETEINNQLFSTQKYDDPAFAMFKDMEQYILHVAKKQANALVICGPPGMSKTYTVRRTLHFNGFQPRRDYAIEKGSSLGLESTYALLYRHRKKLLILDDFDTPLLNDDTVNLLKAITDTYGKRIISLPRDKQMASSGDVQRSSTPDKFEFAGQIIIITNLLKNQISPALLSRAPAFEVYFNTKKVIDSLEKLLKFVHPTIANSIKQEVYDYICLLYKYDPNINVSFRSFTASVDARIGNPHAWKQMVKIIVSYNGKTISENYINRITKLLV